MKPFTVVRVSTNSHAHVTTFEVAANHRMTNVRQKNKKITITVAVMVTARVFTTPGGHMFDAGNLVYVVVS